MAVIVNGGGGGGGVAPSAPTASVRRAALAAVLANVPTFVYGVSVGWMSPMAPLLQSAETPSSAPLSDGVVSWMAGCLSLGAALSTPLFGLASDRFGRKPAILAISLLFAISWSIKLASAEAVPLVAARAVAGLATGGIYLVVPIYVREISEDCVRGALGSIMMFACNLGVVVVYAVGVALSYHQNLWLYLAIPLLHIAVFLFVPESPAYSVMINRSEDAARSIAWLRALDVSDPIVMKEVAQLVKENLVAKDSPKLTLCHIVRNEGLRTAVRMAFLVITTETMSGCFAVIQYASLIFYRSGVTSARPEHLALFVGATQLAGSVLSIYAVERCGRKPLLLTSTLVISCCMCTLATWFLLSAHGVSAPGWLPVVAVCLCIFSYGAGLASVPFVIVAEIFSVQVRARLAGAVTAASWFISTLTVSLFVPVANAYGDHAVFYVFTSITFAGALYTLFCVPETKNKPLAEIQALLEGRKLQNMTRD